MDLMVDLFIKVLAVLFVAVGPIENSIVFAGLTHHYTARERFQTALKGCLVATCILFVFPLVGDYILKLIDLQFYALKLAGGILLMILSVQIVMSDYETAAELAAKHKHRKDLSVFPLGIPLIAGPATITQSMVLITDAGGGWSAQAIVLGAIAVLMLFSFFMFMIAGRITRVLGDGAAEVLSRAMGVILGAIAMGITVDGLKLSGLFS